MNNETTTETWIIEHVWICDACNKENLFRNDKCLTCGQPKGAGHKEHVPTDMSYENRVKDTTRFDDKRPDWFCSYCPEHTRNPASASVCKECGSSNNEKYGTASFDQDTTAGGVVLDPVTPPTDSFSSVPSESEPEAVRAVESEVRKHEFMDTRKSDENGEPEYFEEFHSASEKPEKIHNPNYKTPSVMAAPGAHYRDVKYQPNLTIQPSSSSPRRGSIYYLAAAFVAFCMFIYGCYWFFTWHSTVATVNETTWHYHVDLYQRAVYHGTDWKNREPPHAFNETCHVEIRGYHQCRPYQCRPHQVGFSCHCSQERRCTTSTPCERRCVNRGNGSSRCSNVCRNVTSCSLHTSCETCYRTVYDTCYNQCPDYDQKCEYSYPVWSVIRGADTIGTNHTLVRPVVSTSNTVTCLSDPETIYMTNPNITLCTVDSVEFHVAFNTRGHGQYSVAPSTLAEYNRYIIGDNWNAEYNNFGSFRVTSKQQ